MRGVTFRSMVLAAGLFAVWAAGWSPAQAQLAWDAGGFFQYNVLYAARDPATGQVGVIFSVTNPSAGNVPWNIKTDAPFTLPGARLALEVPEVGRGNEIDDNLRLTEVVLHPTKPRIGFLLDCTWEDEHGFGVRIDDFRVAEVGDAAVASAD